MRITTAVFFLLCFCGLMLPSHSQRMQLRPEFQEKEKQKPAAEQVKPATHAASTEETKSVPAPKKSGKAESTEAPAEAPKRVNVRWYGQSFVYLTTTTGVRVAIDPYGESTVTYPFPPKLSADVVLISNESEAYSSAERIFGSPLVFRSITSIGLNRASGFTFKGVHAYKDREKGKRAGTNTIYTFTLDEVRFAHLGCLGHPLDSRIREEIGYVDVLFVPVGLKTLAVEEWRRIAKELRARVIVPIAYKSNYNANIDLRPLEEFLQGQTNIVPLKSDQFDISRQELPVEPAIYIPQYP